MFIRFQEQETVDDVLGGGLGGHLASPVDEEALFKEEGFWGS